MLSFEVRITKFGEEINVFADDAGLDYLIEVLQDLKQDEGGHIHLMADDPPLGNLDKTTPSGRKAILEVVINHE